MDCSLVPNFSKSGTGTRRGRPGSVPDFSKSGDGAGGDGEASPIPANRGLGWGRRRGTGPPRFAEIGDRGPVPSPDESGAGTGTGTGTAPDGDGPDGDRRGCSSVPIRDSGFHLLFLVTNFWDLSRSPGTPPLWDFSNRDVEI